MDAPISYKDPYWATIAANAERTVGIPSGLLTAVFTHGEKTDNGRVSSAGAKSPFQIIPGTRDAYLKKYGVDAYLSPENAAEVGALHLKESLDRNRNDPSIAVAEYHAGPNRANWGPITAKYVERVMSNYAPNTAQNTPVTQANNSQQATNNVALKDSTYSRALAAQQGGASGQTGDIASVYAAYKAGAMPPEDAAAFEGEVNAGRMLLPRGAVLNFPDERGAALDSLAGRVPRPQGGAQPSGGTVIPQAMAQAYQSGAMNGQDRIEFEALVKNGTFKMPDGVQIGQVAPPPSIGQRIAGVGDAIAGIPGAIKEAVTGAQRTTPETQALPDWAGMPELNSLSMASLKTALGTMASSPQETVQIIQANAPGVGVRQDEKGNYILKSAKDGKEYAIKPGFQLSDIPRALGTGGAFVAGGAGTGGLLAMGAKSAAVQAGIEGSQAATGGTFNPGDVALAGVLGAGLPAALQGAGAVVNAGKNAASRVLNKAAAGMPEMPMAGVIPQADAAAAALPVAVPAPPVITPTAQTAGNIEAVQAAARTAAQGGFGSKKATQSLADMVAPDAQTVAAAERLGVLGDLQPGHITTNGAYRQLDQLVKSQTGSPALQAQREGLLKVVEKANGYIEAMGGAADGDVSTLSAKVLAEGQASIKQVKASAGKMFDKVDAAIPAATPIEVTNTVGMIRARAANIGGEANLSGAEKQILGKLSGESVQPVYGLINDIRTQLNAAKYGKAQEAFQGIDDKLRDNLINALRADQGAAAKAAGVGAEFESAQALSRAYKGTQEDMKVIFGKALDKSLGPMLKNATKDLASGNDATFIKLITATPSELRQEVVATGLQSFFNASTRGGEMNFGAYAQWFENLAKQKQAYTALMANLPKGAPQQLADLARVSRGIAMSKGEFIATGKALNTKALEQADGFANRIFDMVKERGMAGLMAETIGTTSGAPGLATAVGSMLTKNKPTVMQSADKLISSPEFMKAVTATVQQKPAAVKAMSGSAVFSKFAKDAGNPPAMKNREQWITSAMQATQNKKGKK